MKDVLDLHRAGEGLPARRARDPAKREAAEVRNRTAWARVVWAIDGLHALVLLRDELLERQHELTATFRTPAVFIALHHSC